MSYRFYICDVFTEKRFGGNPLAVLPDARGLSDARMQQIAREFNFSESTFVFSAEGDRRRRVRIFTPAREVPFAGHPNIGTAFVLAGSGEFGALPPLATVTFEENAGPVEVSIRTEGSRVVWCELAAPEALSFGRTVDPRRVAAVVSLTPEDLRTDTHEPRVASVGLPFLFTEVRDLDALERARVDLAGAEALLAEGIRPSLHLYVKTGEDTIRARMFAPLSGVAEDPATGSAACALAGVLAHHRPEPDGSFTWRITQGVEMGRPSALTARAGKEGGEIRTTGVGGASVMVAEGLIHAADDPR
jgi:trans-2,3-dihydro-3-hydroxyanthranilate isomerase